MKTVNKDKAGYLLGNKQRHVIKDVVDRSGTDINRCLHCQSCGGGCPVSDAMTYRPNGIIRLFQLGFIREALESSDIWFCIGCNTCSMACPSCMLRLKTAQMHLKNDLDVQNQYQDTLSRPVDLNLEIIHFFELLTRHFSSQPPTSALNTLKGLKFVPYYGCMLNRPPDMRHDKNYYGLVEKILAYFGAESHTWSFSSRCCGTFLSVAKPAVVTPMVNRIMKGAIDAKADCIVTACAMCQLNLEIRCTLNDQIPTFHFSEILSMALGLGIKKSWLSSHLVDVKTITNQDH